MRRRLVRGVYRVVFVLVVAFLVAYLGFIRPWHLRWGATPVEVHRVMPGDTLVRNPSFNATRAITVRARPADIWPWIAQMGAGRAGFYGYDWFDNGGTPSDHRILPQYQSPQAGDAIPTRGDARGYLIKGFEVNRYMLWLARNPRATLCWGLYPIDGTRTRVVVRLRFQHPWTSPTIVRTLATDVGDIVLTRRMLLGLKERAEATAHR